MSRTTIHAALAVALWCVAAGAATACRLGPPATSYEGLSPDGVPASPDDPASDDGAPSLRLDLVYSDFDAPLQVANAADGSGRLFVVEKEGSVYAIDTESGERTTYLDLSEAVSTTSEQGLLSIAFSPEFSNDRRLYVDYTDLGGDTVVSRMTERGGVADATTEEVLLGVEQPYANHNGGQLAFGPDGYLYVGLGDGGSGGDPQGNGQDPGTLLGSILRIDVSVRSGYAVPRDNPFADGGGAPEIWAYGLRNPWRFSFDEETGDLWIGDVGQNRWEEIDREPAGSPGGLNYGWRAYEGTHRYGDDSVVPKNPAMPVIEYGREEGTSVTGGFVYRGQAIPGLEGWYVWGDFGSGRIWGARAEANPDPVELFDTDLAISSFGVDEDGELYVVDYARGAVYALVAAK